MGGQAGLGLIWESFNARCKQINLPPDLLGGLSPAVQVGVGSPPFSHLQLFPDS